jgi:hypothetical protein
MAAARISDDCGEEEIDVRGYLFLDMKTGITSHGDVVSSFELSSPTKKARATFHLIDDVRF